MARPQVATKTPAPITRASSGFLLFAGILGAALAVLFYKLFEPHQILFANDGPLGAMVADCNQLPGRLFGTWRDNQWIGVESPSASPSISVLFGTIFSPQIFLTIYGPFTIFFVGFCAWVFFRSLEFKPPVCILGGIAAGLNMHFFSTACWGLGSWDISAGMIFLALAALCTKSIKQMWARVILAGLAVGMNLMEGFDVGAILSIYVGIFVVFRAFSEESGLKNKLLTAVGSELVVVFFAGFIAAHTIISLVGTQITGIKGTGQEAETKEQRWRFATQWSLPKLETLRLFIPGIFGYRLEGYISTPDHSEAYWGTEGRDLRYVQLMSDDPRIRAGVMSILPLVPPEIEGMNSSDRETREATAEKIRVRIGMYLRHSGTGEYAGILVGILALFAFACSCRGSSTPFAPPERRAVWFWGGAALFSLLAAWGWHGFLYALLYHLPYFSTIRNPVKFLQAFHIAWLIMAAYGMEALHRRYLQTPAKRTDILPQHLMNWMRKAAGFEKKWAIASLVAIALSLAGLVGLISYRVQLMDYFEKSGFKVALVPHMADFCTVEMVWFIFFLVCSTAVVTGVISGAWGGSTAKWAWIFMGVILVFDLGRSDIPWIHTFDYKEKYSPNPVVDFLAAKKPYEQRIIGRLAPRGPGSANSGAFGGMYTFWMQNDFPYHNLQTLDFAEMPRMPNLDDAYLRTFQLNATNLESADLRPAVRLWELTGTRYVLCDVKGGRLLNERGDPTHRAFHVVAQLDQIPKPDLTVISDPGDYTVQLDPKGVYGLIEFDRALPRVKLFGNWQTPTNDQASLAILASEEFDPQKLVLVSPETPAPQATGNSNTDPGEVDILEYKPRFVKMKASVKTPAILLFNDRYSPEWTASVDSQSATLLRCNYIMRGLFLTPGEHTIQFHYRPPLKTLYISLAAWVVGLFVAGFVIWSGRTRATASSK